MILLRPGSRVIHSADSAHLCRTDLFPFAHLFQALQHFLSAIDPEHIHVPELPALHIHSPAYFRAVSCGPRRNAVLMSE